MNTTYTPRVEPISTSSEWTFENINAYYDVLNELAEEYGLDCYPNQIEIISSEQMLDAYCITPDHKLLRDDLRWVTANEIQCGDTVLGFDENGPHRAYRKAVVINTERDLKEVFEVLLSSGKTFNVTGNHMWLVRQQKGDASTLTWKPTRRLRTTETTTEFRGPSLIPKVMDTWVEDQSKDAGWLAGLYDGEANLVRDTLQSINVSQNKGVVLERLERVLTERDIPFSIADKPDTDSCRHLRHLGDMSFKLKFLGEVRPERLISKLDFDRLGLMKTPNYEEVVSIKSIGIQEIIKISTSTGTFICDGYPMHNSSIGMPIFYSHWSFGQEFIKQQQLYKKGYMGLAYEIVINSNPAIAYLMEENTMLMQLLVIAHACFGHNAFFKNNYLFQQWTDADSIIDYLVFAKKYIAQCEEKYGSEEVEAVLDACHSLQRYGIDKYKRPSKLSVQEEEKREVERQEYLQSQLNEIWTTIPILKTDDSKDAPEVFPKTPQENILYFVEKNAPHLDQWKREIIRIVRKIAQYFYPQMQTKVMNEGFASFWHYTLVNDLYDRGYINDGYMKEFLITHTNIITQLPFWHPRYSGINPYALGFAMFQDIKRISIEPTSEDKKYFDFAGNEDWVGNVMHAMKNFKDESFILQYLSPKVIRDFKLFAILDVEEDPKLEVSAIHNDSDYKRVKQALAAQYNIGYIIPDIQVQEVDRWGDRSLKLRHNMVGKRPLNNEETTEGLKRLSFLWGYDVYLDSVDDRGRLHASFAIKEDEALLDIFLDDADG